MSYVRLKHALSAIALESLRHPEPWLVVSAMAAYARRSETGAAVPAEGLARDVAAAPDAVRRALLDTGLFAGGDDGIAFAAAYRSYAAYFRRQVTRLVEARRLAAQPASADVPPDVHRGLALFNAGLFFECHEYFEDVWRASRAPEREFYHGLVQAAAGCYHAEKGNAHGAAVLLLKAREKLKAYAPRYLGVDVAGLVASLEMVRGGTAPQEAFAPPGILPRPARPPQ